MKFLEKKETKEEAKGKDHFKSTVLYYPKLPIPRGKKNETSLLNSLKTSL